MSGTNSIRMMSREELLNFFTRFSSLVSQLETKKRISEAVQGQKEAVALTTALKEEIFLEMGIDPSFGSSCLGKMNAFYENDQELMIQFYRFVAKDEMTCEEAQLEPDEFSEKIRDRHVLQEQQLDMLRLMRKYALDDQSVILDQFHKQMENGNLEFGLSVLSSDQIQEIVRRRVSPLYKPR